MPEKSRSLSRRLSVVLQPQELELRTWIQMVRTLGRMERALEQALSVHGLSLPQFDVLATLAMGEGISQQELAERLLVTKGNVCGLLGRIESAGWIERRPDDKDRRANRLFLTSSGRDLLAKAIPAHKAILSRAMAALQPPEIQTLHQLLDRLEDGTAA